MRSRRVAVTAAAAAVVLLLAGCSSSSQASGSGSDRGFVAGDGSLVLVPADQRVPAPDLTGQTLDGQTFSLRDHIGDVVVMNVWASWCAPCRAEAPTLAALAADYAHDDVQFVGLDTRDSDVSARSFVARQGIGYPSVVDSDGRLQLLFGDSLPPQAIPSTLVIDRQGRVAARALGKVSDSTLRGFVEPLLAERAS
jgi:thiol-disulfide isomerase/thioredoxin